MTEKTSTPDELGVASCSLCGRVPMVTMDRGSKDGSHLKGWIARCCRELRVPIWADKTKTEATHIFNQANVSDLAQPDNPNQPQIPENMAEETDYQKPDSKAVDQPHACYADVARHLHDEASKIEAEALPLMKEGFLHDGYRKLDLSSSLRTAANYLDGVSASSRFV